MKRFNGTERRTTGRATGLGRRTPVVEALEQRQLLAVEALGQQQLMPVRIDPDGPGPLTPIDVAQFIFAAGNALAQGSVVPGVGLQVGDTFQLYFQATLVGFTGPGGAV